MFAGYFFTVMDWISIRKLTSITSHILSFILHACKHNLITDHAINTYLQYVETGPSNTTYEDEECPGYPVLVGGCSGAAVAAGFV